MEVDSEPFPQYLTASRNNLNSHCRFNWAFDPKFCGLCMWHGSQSSGHRTKQSEMDPAQSKNIFSGYQSNLNPNRIDMIRNGFICEYWISLIDKINRVLPYWRHHINVIKEQKEVNFDIGKWKRVDVKVINCPSSRNFKVKKTVFKRFSAFLKALTTEENFKLFIDYSICSLLSFKPNEWLIDLLSDNF